MTDHDGAFIHRVSTSFAGIQDPHLAEFLALREALLTVQLLGLHPVSFIDDSQNVIAQVLDEETCPMLCSPILKDIKNLLHVVHCQMFFWKRRSFNVIAHELAFYAKMNSPSNTSWSSLPNFLLSFSVG